MQWLLVGLVRSLKSSHKEALDKPLLCEDYRDLTSPTSNQILHMCVFYFFGLNLDRFITFNIDTSL